MRYTARDGRLLRTVPPNKRPVVTLYADGGTIDGSPGTGIYWSIGNDLDGVLRYEDRSGKRRRSDEAEYLAILTAFHVLVRSPLGEGDVAVVYSDCRPTVNHLLRSQKPRTVRLRGLYWDTQETLLRLGERGVRVVLLWTKRSLIVEKLGH